MDNPLTRKLGPLPVWAWAGIAVGGYVIYTHVYSRSTAGADGTIVPANDGSQVDDSGYTDATYANDGTDLTEAGQGTTTDDEAATGSAVTTNAQWSYLAIQKLVSQNQSPTDAGTAIFKYLNGQPLTSAEQSIVNSAIQQLGPPPENPARTTTVSDPKGLPPGPYYYRATGPAWRLDGKRVTINSVAGIASHWGVTRDTVLQYNPTWQGKYNLGKLPIGIPIRLPKGTKQAT